MADPLRSARLVYRAWEFPGDIDFYMNMKQDTIAWANSTLSILRPTTREQMEKQVRGFADDSLISVIICLPAEPSANTDEGDADKESKPKLIPVGSMGLSSGSNSQSHHRHAMIGLEIDSRYRNKGYGSEAIQWMLGWGFNIAGLHHIDIGTASYNTGAIKLYDRLGFVREARKREYVWYNGEFHDLIEWSMLEHEFRERYGKKAGPGDIQTKVVARNP